MMNVFASVVTLTFFRPALESRLSGIATIVAISGGAWRSAQRSPLSPFLAAVRVQPDRERPQDTYGLKLNWQRLNPAFAAYQGEANRVSCGSGQAYQRDKLVVEVNARFELGQGIGFEPVVQYVVNADSFYEPRTALRAKDGIFVGASLVVPLGSILGLTTE